MFSHLALIALQQSGHPLGEIAAAHAARFRIAGIAGCDIQCMPYQVCQECDAPYRHNQSANKRCLVCGKATLRNFSFKVSDGRKLTRVDVERDYYRNTHLVLGRRNANQPYGLDPKVRPGKPEQPFPEQVVRHLANMFRDVRLLDQDKERTKYLSFTLGWFSHVVSDALFKGVYRDTARVNFFGHQYNMAMLPAAEALTMTDISYDFGVHWPTWHEELRRGAEDAGALRHVAMGNPASRYDKRFWTAEFGEPDEAIGRVIDAVEPLTCKWLHRMYLNPDYTAATPALDQRKLTERGDWTFNGMNLGQLRGYALTTGWYETFIRGVEVFLRVVNQAWELSSLTSIPKSASAPKQKSLSWELWKRIVEESIDKGKKPADWGSFVEVAPEIERLLKGLRGKSARLSLPNQPTDYQLRLRAILQKNLGIGPRKRAPISIIIGSPAFNQNTQQHSLCGEDILRFKYDSGLAGLIKCNTEGNVLHIVGLSDFGDNRLAETLKQCAA